MWIWDANAPGGSGGGASADPGRARAAAEAWLSATPGASPATLAPVTLGMDGYVPAGDALGTRRRADGGITWARRTNR